MLTILLIVLILMMLGGWGYGRGGSSYGNPMGIVGVLLVVVLVVYLVRGGF
jgi:hypothetical protein